LERAATAFGAAAVTASGEDVALAKAHAKIGQLSLENDFLERALTKAGLLSAAR
jgi:transposase